MKRFLVLLFIMASVSLYANELLEVPDDFQGVWHTVAYSTDQGTTILDGNNLAFLRMYGTKAIMANGVSRTFNKIEVVKENDTYYLFIHPDGLDSYWVVSEKGNNSILVQIWNIDDNKETARFLFIIQK